MFKKELISHLFVTFAWLLVISLLRWDWQFNLFLLWLGGLAGTFLLDLDHLIYSLWLYPQELVSLRVKRFLAQKQFKEAFSLLSDTHEERFKFVFHNALFQLVFWIVCLFVITSSGSLFGTGLVMAMALHLLKDEIECLIKGRKGETYLRQWLFWPIKGQVSFTHQRFFVAVMVVIFSGLNLFLI